MPFRVDRSDPSVARLTFVLPADEPPGAVSVVGSFNDWAPGALDLAISAAGERSATVSIPCGRAVHFRYLGDDGI